MCATCGTFCCRARVSSTQLVEGIRLALLSTRTTAGARAPAFSRSGTVMRGAFKGVIVAAATVFAFALAPAVAHAEGYVSPWASAQAGSSFNNGRAGFGVDAGGMGAGIVGGELDFGYSPSVFGTNNDFGNNS